MANESSMNFWLFLLIPVVVGMLKKQKERYAKL